MPTLGQLKRWATSIPGSHTARPIPNITRPPPPRHVKPGRRYRVATVGSGMDQSTLAPQICARPPPLPIDTNDLEQRQQVTQQTWHWTPVLLHSRHPAFESPTCLPHAMLLQCPFLCLMLRSRDAVSMATLLRGLLADTNPDVAILCRPPPRCPTNALSNQHFRSDRIFWDRINWVPGLGTEFRVQRTLLFGLQNS